MHHENVDGSGYPRGLKGDEIPLLGRIVSVADAFDAMTTDRPYSKAMTFEAAIARLRFLAGKKFDPECVEAFERAFVAGDVSPAKARRASVASRHFDLNALIGETRPPPRRRPRPRGGAARIGVTRDDDRSEPTAALRRRRRPRPASPPRRSRRARPTRRSRFSTGVMHLREGRVDLALEEFKRAVKEDPKNPYFQKGLGLAYAAKRRVDGRRSPRSARRSSSTPTTSTRATTSATRSSCPGDREEGKKEFLAAFSDPMNPTPEISAHNLGLRATSRRRTTPRPSTGSAPASNRNKAYSEAYLLLAETLVAVGPSRRGGGAARGGRQRDARRRPGCCSRSARPTTRSAASPRRGRGSRRR